MKRTRGILKPFVASLVLCGGLALPAMAQEADLDDLFENLRSTEGDVAKAISEKIWAEWSKSGSPSMDLLLARGREAAASGDLDTAIGHFTALIDHAPEFAEGYNARATAYFQKGLYGPSLEDIRMTLALNPRHFGALSGLALILEELGHEQDALEAWRMVEKIYPHQEGLEEALIRLGVKVEGQTL